MFTKLVDGVGYIAKAQGCALLPFDASGPDADWRKNSFRTEVLALKLSSQGKHYLQSIGIRCPLGAPRAPSSPLSLAALPWSVHQGMPCVYPDCAVLPFDAWSHKHTVRSKEAAKVLRATLLRTLTFSVPLPFAYTSPHDGLFLVRGCRGVSATPGVPRKGVLPLRCGGSRSSQGHS